MALDVAKDDRQDTDQTEQFNRLGVEVDDSKASEQDDLRLVGVEPDRRLGRLLDPVGHGSAG